MGYYIDLEKITLDYYGEKLKTAYLPPSRNILRENTEERFGYFKKLGINNVKELLQVLKKKDKLNELSKVSCFEGDYLVILLRELNSTLPKPNKIKDFKGISSETITKLENIGLKDTVKLFDKVKTKADRQLLIKQTNISDTELLRLTKLTDLSRIKWVGATFAIMLYQIGIDTVEKAAKADYNEVHQKINQINKEESFFKGHIGLNDMKIFIEAAKDVPLEIEY